MDLDELKAIIKGLSDQDRQALLADLKDDAGRPADTAEAIDALEERRFSNGRFCPYCSGNNVVRDGKQKDGTQRFLCKDCGRRFQASSGTLMTGTLKRAPNPSAKEAVLRKYVHCMCLSLTIRQTARECGISNSTAFRWRHRILDSLAATMSAAVLGGIVEMDETFFTLNFKGNLSDQARAQLIPWGSRKRGGGLKFKSGTDLPIVCVPTAVSREGTYMARLSNLGAPKTSDVLHAVGGKLQANAVVVSDGAKLYRKLATDAKVPLKLVQIKGGKGTRGLYSIQHVNAYHSSLKEFINGHFRGVATKYLNNYLRWQSFMKEHRDDLDEMEELLFQAVIAGRNPCTTRELPGRDAIPILSEGQRRMIRYLLLRIAQCELEAKEKKLREKAAAQAANANSTEPVTAEELEDVPF